MKRYRDLAEEFISTLRAEIVESQNQIEQIRTSGMRIGERLCGGSWSDVTDREIALLKSDISSRERTIARLKEELGSLPGKK